MSETHFFTKNLFWHLWIFLPKKYSNCTVHFPMLKQSTKHLSFIKPVWAEMIVQGCLLCESFAAVRHCTHVRLLLELKNPQFKANLAFLISFTGTLSHDPNCYWFELCCLALWLSLIPQFVQSLKQNKKMCIFFLLSPFIMHNNP